MPKKKRHSKAPPTPLRSSAPLTPEHPSSDAVDPTDLVVKNIHPLLAALEQIRGHKIVSYFLDEHAAIADEQVIHFYEHLRRLGRQDCLGLWLHSRGGATEVPWKIVSLFREFTQRFVVLVPYRAHSAATLIALGADEIMMTEMAELGPVDPSRKHPLLPREEQPDGSKEPIPISVQDMRHLLKFVEREMGKDNLTPDAAATVYTKLFDKVHPLAIGAMEQSWALAQQIGEQCLATHMDREQEKDEIAHIMNRLSDFYMSHLYQISRDEARDIGLNVTSPPTTEANAIWELYLAYTHIQLQADGSIDGSPAVGRRLGHIDSVQGATIGIQLVSKSDPKKHVSQWQSKWLGTPAVASQAPATPAPQPSISPGPPVSSAD